MAISPNLFKEWYKDLSVEELEGKYNEIKAQYTFNSKEECIKDFVDNYLMSILKENTDTAKQVIEELLLEKTGKQYSMDIVEYPIDLEGVIDYISDDNELKKENITKFINSIDIYEFEKDNYKYEENIDEHMEEIVEFEKVMFLVKLYQDKESFNKFTEEITHSVDNNALYLKYKEIARQYCSNHMYIG